MGESDDPSLLDRIYSWAKAHASDRIPFVRQDSARSLPASNSGHSNVLPSSSAPSAIIATSEVPVFATDGVPTEKPDPHEPVDNSPISTPPPAPPPHNIEDARNTSSPIEAYGKPPWSTRAKAGSKRFASHTKDALTHSWINVLLVFVPVGIALEWVPMPGTTKPTVVFAMNAIAIIPLAGLLSHATESVASRMGDTWASLLNVTFGNAVELIIFIIALAKNEIRIVQASILGSILANLLLILGMAFVLGGLRYREQIYNSTVTQMSACLLSLSVVSLLLPTAFHASFANSDEADDKTTRISRGTSVVLLLIYVLYLAFQLKSHAYLYESTPQHIVDEESHPGILADLMNSSSDSSSSSSDGDSDSSSDSATTARKIRRVLKHGRRRKSSASSVFTNATNSATSSPPTGRNKRHKAEEVRHGDAYATTADPQPPLLTDDEGDMSTRKAKPDRKLSKRKKKNTRKRHNVSKQEHQRAYEQGSLYNNHDNSRTSANDHHVAFSEDFVGQADIPTSRARPLVKTRPSFRPAIPSLLANTVFTTPPPPAIQQKQPANLSVAYRHHNLRRTNSLPDRLNEQPVPKAVAAEPQQRPGMLAINEADAIRKDHDADGKTEMSRTAAVMLLLISTGLVAFCAELLVDAIPEMIENTTVSQAFIGLIILPIVGNAAEHVTAVTVATKNKMDLAIGVAVGSSIQIALFVTPFVVLLGWIMGKEMSLYFNLFETVSLFVTAFVVNFLVLDGRSNYLEGALLIAAYVIIALAAFYYPNEAQQSALGGSVG
ncbi:hypothetical protein FH972_026909 [Carpinus fangiana]|uniref:Sodium/calcium exchanger membrane region domain-containing protein n=1 Tax=Carpinus fangiana TaxID=176857 RepID=A0A5N6L5F3_9ROSI|nr:hypothetical protein FH972_026909 [Carpinus fangiana]